jgi:hypothetical protein
MSAKAYINGIIASAIMWAWPIWLWVHTGRALVGLAGMGVEIIWGAVVIVLVVKVSEYVSSV